ncbi:MAG: glycosyltransferase family 9 protein [Fibrobacterales bacterium]
MALYLIDSLRRYHPEFTLEFLVDAECKDLIQYHPHIEHCHILPRSSIQNHAENNDYSCAYDLLREALKQLLSTHYTISINLFQDDYSAILQSMISADVKKGKRLGPFGEFIIGDTWSRYLYAIPANRKANRLHAIDIYHRIAGINTYTRPVASLPPCNLPKHLLNSIPNDCIAIQQGSAWSGKKWPLSYWSESIRSIIDNGIDHIVLIGAPQEYDSNEILRAIAPSRISNVAGATSLLEVSQVLKRARLLITGDTFAMHMATAVSCPVIALFGPSNPIETGPYGAHHFIIQSNHTTLNDFDLKTDVHKSLLAIQPTTVADLALSNIPLENCLSETFWNTSQSYQFLVNSDASNHSIVASLSITPDITAVNIDEVTSFLKAIELKLTAYLGTIPSPAQSAELAQLDGSLYQCTQNNLSFELYRITLNSIPIDSVDLYLNQRLDITKYFLKSLSNN